MKYLSTVTLAVLLCTIAILLGSVSITDGDSTPDCCFDRNIPSECHFLCGTAKAPFFSVARWQCTFKYYATIRTCQVKGLIDYVKMFGHKLTRSVADGFDQLSQTIKDKLTEAGRFVQLSVDELRKIPQDVLGSLKDGVQDMTTGQFTGIIGRLKFFTRQNLHAVISKIPDKTFTDALQSLNLEIEFDNDQLRELALGGLRAFGKNVGNWTADTLNKMNNLLAGLETSEIVEIAGNALELSHTILCDVNFNDDQKKSLYVPVKKAFGEIAGWDEQAIKQVCKVFEVIPPTQLLKLSSKAISKSAKFLKDRKFFVPQARALIIKLKEGLGEVDSWDDINVKDLGNLLKGLNTKEIASFLQDTVKKALAEIGKVDWNEAQAREWIKKAKETLGDPAEWTVDNLRDLGNTAVAILPGDLQKIGNATLFQALVHLNKVEVHLDQAQVIIGKIKEIKNLKDITKADLIAMQKLFDGFLSSDIGRFGKVAVLAAFPELLIAERIGKMGMPVLRAFIEQYKNFPGDGKIGLLKGFAKVLTRVELNVTDIKQITIELQAVGLIEWDITQALELMQRIKREWGDFNGTDDDFDDEPQWGFKNFQKLGRIALGLSKEDLRTLPVRGIEDVVEVLGKNKGWGRGQIVATLNRVREYWEIEELDLTNLTETDINGLGQFVSGLALTELRKLPEKVLHTAVKRLGENFGLPHDKLRSRAFLAIELLKNETGIDLLDGSQVSDLGNLLKGVNRAVLEKITKEGFVDNLYQMTRIDGMSDDRLWQMVQLAKKHFGKSDVGQWLAEQWRDLGPAIRTMDVSELRRISKDAFDDIIDELGELDVLSDKQARVLIEKAKEFWKQSDVGKWSGEQLRKLGSIIKGLKPDEIRRLSPESLKEAIGSWGERLDLNVETLVALAERAKEVFVESNVTEIVAGQLKMWGRVVLGLTAEDLEKLNIDNIDVIGALGKWKGWTKQQLAKLAPKIKEFLRKANNPDFYMSLGHLATILQPDDIKLLSKISFEFSAKLFGQTDGWTKEQLKALADKAKVSWGAIELWESAQVSELGDIVEGLKASDISKLRSSVINVIKSTVIGKLVDEQIQAFTPDQLKSMDSSQVNMINEATILYMSAEQREAVQAVKDDDPDDSNPWPEERCAGPGCPDSASTQFLPSLILLLITSLFWSF